MVQVSAATAVAATFGILVHFASLARAFVVVHVHGPPTKNTAFFGPSRVRRRHRWEDDEATIHQRCIYPPRSSKLMRFCSTLNSHFLATPLVGRQSSTCTCTTTQRFYRNSEGGDDDANIRTLYRTVAEQDPEWFQKFVIELLGEDDDILDPEMIALAKRKPGLQQIAEATSPPDLSPLSVEPTITGKHQSDNVATEVAGAEEMTMTALMEGHVADALSTENRTLISNGQHSEMKKATSSTTNLQFADMIDEKDESQQDKGNNYNNGHLVLEKELLASAVGRPSSILEDTKILPIAAEPLLSDSPSDTAKDNGNVELERAEPPLKSEITHPDSPQTGDVPVELQSTAESQSPPLPTSAATEIAKKAATVTTSAPPPTTTTVSTSEQLDERVVLYEDGFTKEWKCVPLATLIGLGYSEEEIKSLQPDALDLIVHDPIRRPRSGIPQRWKILDSDAAIRIVAASEWDEERTTKLTVRKTQPNDEFETEHTTLTESESKPLPTEPTIQTGSTMPSRRSTSVPPDPKAATVADKDQAANGGYSVQGHVKNTETSRASHSSVGGIGNVDNGGDPMGRRSRTGADSPRGERRVPTTSSPRDRHRDAKRRVDRQKTVYSARPSPQQKVMRVKTDDPPSSSGLWPDMDTFRRLLRHEAAMRLKFLGDDWTSAVKEEADWRHDIYKNWLWN